MTIVQISMAEIASRDESMLYGSFGIRMKVTGIAGTCTGFFWVSHYQQKLRYR